MAAKKKAEKKAPAKKAPKKTTTKRVARTKVRAVTAQGIVYLENGVKTSCSVGKGGPVLKAGDVVIKVGDSWGAEK